MKAATNEAFLLLASWDTVEYLRGDTVVETKATLKAVNTTFVCLFNLLLNVPFHTLVYFRDGSAQTILRAATLR